MDGELYIEGKMKGCIPRKKTKEELFSWNLFSFKYSIFLLMFWPSFWCYGDSHACL